MGRRESETCARSILVATFGVANELRDALSKAKADFGAMARAMSLCEVTSVKKGDVGWLDGKDVVDDATEALLPLTARLELDAQAPEAGGVTCGRQSRFPATTSLKQTTCDEGPLVSDEETQKRH